jgi:hypothetical protein
MRTQIIIIMAIVAILILPSALQAQETGPMSVINAWQDAMNANDADTALGFLADDAFIKLVPPPVEGHDGVFSGKEAIREWWEGLYALNGESSLSECQVEGGTVTCMLRYSDDSLKSIGVDYIDNEFVVIVRDGKIQTYTATMTDESLAAFMAALATLPETGGVAFPAHILALVFGSLALLGGLGLVLRRRHLTSS